MSPSNTRDQSRPRAQSRSRSKTNTPARRPFFASLFSLPRMPPVFNIVRVCVYGEYHLLISENESTDNSSLNPVAVLVWTIVCLAIAAHFLSILQASDLSECTNCPGLWGVS